MSGRRVLTLPRRSLIVLVGPSGAGKSTFASRHFRPTEVVSSDGCRALVADDENDQSVTQDAFEVLHLIVAKRLAADRLAVVDATNVQVHARRELVALAQPQHAPLHAILFDLPLEVCEARNATRTDRSLPDGLILHQLRQMHRARATLRDEGFAAVHSLRSVAEVDAVEIVLS